MSTIKNNVILKMSHRLTGLQRDTDANSTRKYAPHYMSTGKCRLKQCNITIHLIEWLKFGTQPTPKADKDVEQQIFSVSEWEWYSHMVR